METSNATFILSNKAYDILKWGTIVLLPALGTLYFGLGNLWGFPYIEEVVGSIAVLETFLGALIGVSTKNYKGDGVIEIDQTSDPELGYFQVNTNDTIDKIAKKKEILLKVNVNGRYGEDDTYVE